MRPLIAILVSVLTVSCAAADPAPAPAPALTGPLPADAGIDQILDALHLRGQGLKDFSADVTMTEIDALTGDKTILSGKVWYQSQAAGQARLRVIFDQKQVGQRKSNDKVEWLLDQGWLHERDHKRRMQIDRQVLKPGQKMDLLKLGEGPFPLPVGQEPDEVKKLFEVKLGEPRKDAPKDTVHLQLVPRTGTQFVRKFKRLEVWVDREGRFPRQIETTDRNETETRVTDLANLKVNQGVADAVFVLEKLPDVQNWTIKSEPLQE